jgi:hypothetical protein
VRGVDRAPPCLGGLDELVGHGQPGGFGPGAFGDLGAARGLLDSLDWTRWGVRLPTLIHRFRALLAVSSAGL